MKWKKGMNGEVEHESKLDNTFKSQPTILLFPILSPSIFTINIYSERHKHTLYHFEEFKLNDLFIPDQSTLSN